MSGPTMQNSKNHYQNDEEPAAKGSKQSTEQSANRARALIMKEKLAQQ